MIEEQKATKLNNDLEKGEIKTQSRERQDEGKTTVLDRLNSVDLFVWYMDLGSTEQGHLLRI